MWTDRDEFAARAMQALLAELAAVSARTHTELTLSGIRDIANLSYAVADEMGRAAKRDIKWEED